MLTYPQNNPGGNKLQNLEKNAAFPQNNTMKILLITRYFPPLESVATNRMASWVKHFSKMGHHVTVCTTAKSKTSDNLEKVDVFEVPYFDPVTYFGGDRLKQKQDSGKTASSFSNTLMSLYRRRFNERMPGRTDFWIRPAIQRLKKEKGFDLIISSYGPPSAHMIGLFAKHHFQSLWFADFRDLWTENHNYKGIWPFTRLEAFLERKVMENADVAITVSNGLKGVLERKYPKSDIRVVPNGFDPDLYPVSALRKSKNFSLVYTGTLFEGNHDIAPLFKALKSFSKPIEVRFYGSSAGYLERMVERFNLNKKVKIMGTVPYREALLAQLEADALLQLDFKSDQYGGLMSGKVYEYLYAGRPILALGVEGLSELGQLITNARGGILCENSPLKIEMALNRLIEEKEIFQNDRIFVEGFSRKYQAEEIISWALTFSQRAMSCSL